MAVHKKEKNAAKGTIITDSGLSVEDYSAEMHLGVMPDDFNYKKLFGLFFAGIALVVVLILFAAELYRYYDFRESFNAAVIAEYPELNSLKYNHTKILTTFEVIDAERGIYRVPVDSAFTLLLND